MHLVYGKQPPSTQVGWTKTSSRGENRLNFQVWSGISNGLQGLFAILKITLKKSAVIATLFSLLAAGGARVYKFKQ